MTGPAIDLLNRRAGHMDAQQVMNIIPDHWSITAISTALQTMFKATVHQVSEVYSIIVLVLVKKKSQFFSAANDEH